MQNLGLTLQIQTLAKLDGGKLVLAANHAIRQAIADVQDRPGDKSARKVTLDLVFRPELDKDAAILDTVRVQGRVNVVIPKRQTVEYPMLPMNNGTVIFQEHSPMEPRQPSFQFGAQAHEEGQATAAEEDDDPIETI